MGLRDCTPFLSQKGRFEVADSEISIATRRNPDKEQLRITIVGLREQGLSYREIAQMAGLHGTRVQQIVNSAE
jgi:DNA-directed RNA polymerase specialized sigma24 family protein